MTESVTGGVNFIVWYPNENVFHLYKSCLIKVYEFIKFREYLCPASYEPAWDILFSPVQTSL